MSVSAGAAARARALSSLSVEEVCGVLHALDLGEYEAAFRALPANGSVLAAADDDDLIEVLHSLIVSTPPGLQSGLADIRQFV